ncbi:MAG: transcriptional regulator [Candidatus Eremiobacterota bacterium]
MTNEQSQAPYSPSTAAEKFYRLQSPGLIRSLLSFFRQRPSERLLSFDEVQELLREKREIPRGTRMIPIENIVGSVGRYRDFDRHFLPLNPASEERWKRLDVALNQMITLPPIEVFQVGQVYFVRDGNHRVSVARANGLREIEAHVTEIPTRVSVTPDVDIDELIGRAQRARFLEASGLDESCDIRLTGSARYEVLLEHIEVHRYYLCLEQHRDLSLQEAAWSWYHGVYQPVLEAIRSTEVLKQFPSRSEADLYLWVAYHRERLREQLGDMPANEEVASSLAEEFSDRPLAGLVRRVTRAIRAAVKAATESPEPP